MQVDDEAVAEARALLQAAGLPGDDLDDAAVRALAEGIAVALMGSTRRLHERRSAERDRPFTFDPATAYVTCTRA